VESDYLTASPLRAEATPSVDGFDIINDAQTGQTKGIIGSTRCDFRFYGCNINGDARLS
jgi:hypothetical protein